VEAKAVYVEERILLHFPAQASLELLLAVALLLLFPAQASLELLLAVALLQLFPAQTSLELLLAVAIPPKNLHLKENVNISQILFFLTFLSTYIA
jgi:hypothetical protein